MKKNTPEILEEKKELQALMTVWHARSTDSANAHYYAADHFKKRNTIWSIINIAAAIIVLFLSNEDTLVKVTAFFHDFIRAEFIALGISMAAVTVVVTTVVQYIYRFNEKANSHKFCANEYSNVKRKIERLKTSGDIDEEALHRMSNTLNWLSKSSPLISRKLFRQFRLSGNENANKTNDDFSPLFRKNNISDLEEAEKRLSEIFGKKDT